MTLAIQLAFDRAAQPEVANPMKGLRTWFRHARNPVLTPLEVAAGWHARCRSIVEAKARGESPWNQTSSAMSRAITILTDSAIIPAAPLEWHWLDEDGVMQKWDMSCPIEVEVNWSLIEEAIADRMWSAVSHHEANGGLEGGEPDQRIPKKVIARLFQEGKIYESRALEHIVCHSTWSGERAHPNEPELAVCV